MQVQVGWVMYLCSLYGKIESRLLSVSKAPEEIVNGWKGCLGGLSIKTTSAVDLVESGQAGTGDSK